MYRKSQYSRSVQHDLIPELNLIPDTHESNDVSNQQGATTFSFINFLIQPYIFFKFNICGSVHHAL